MPLYERKGAKGDKPQRVRTVTESTTDDRLRESEDWQLVDESKTKTKAGDTDERTGTGSAAVNVGQSGGA
ncbi:hypothetical protein [Pseudonocardia sp. McavD-2-B]|uniref:hypothetical protein n=1 Tax=Pseudonocardia sp. McavD-2-B TaxID=2954499 RepID=UPI002097FD27|nr:hypothetical protein [Pseudonocardia sp. McavD-2-B]MCO7195388.1 hypothetical protein [Pseudonocardia sp. McavD-2-B]